MVSLRCKMVVHQELEKLNIRNALVDLGLVEILDDITDEQHRLLKKISSKPDLNYWMIKKHSD
jgi:hypothetical protein